MLFVCFLAVSCRGDDNNPEPPEASSREGFPIGFSVISEKKAATRVNGELATQENFNEMFVIVPQTVGKWVAYPWDLGDGDDEWEEWKEWLAVHEDDAPPTFIMRNQKVTKVDGRWTYSPVKYWPPKDYLSFFAFSPMPSEENGIDMYHDEGTWEAPSFRVTPPASPQKQVDFCLAKPVMNQKYDSNDGKVSLEFKHLMTQITFMAEYVITKAVDNNPAETAEVYIREIKLNNLQPYATLYVNEFGDYVWSSHPYLTRDATYTLVAGEGDLIDQPLPKKEDGLPPLAISTPQGTLCLIPQASKVGTTTFIKLMTEINGTTWEINADLSDYAWEAGNHYSINLVIHIKGSWFYTYTGKVEEFQAPETGTYLLEAWGAKGGDKEGVAEGIPGNYVSGTYELQKGEKLYICVGEKGHNRIPNTGAEGGKNPGKGNRGNGGQGGDPCCSPDHPGGAGGGASSDIRTADTDVDSRILVAGGGGGRGHNFNPQYTPAAAATTGGGGDANGNGAKGAIGSYDCWEGAGGGGGGYQEGGAGGRTLGSGVLGANTYDQTGFSGDNYLAPGIQNGSEKFRVNHNGQVRITLLSKSAN
jgi:hypothetical protein